jgi:Tat protein secretion system quality control protein TatD with DNase activity
MIETDAPYMGFKNCRKSCSHGSSKEYPNVPAALPLIADAVAQAMGIERSVLLEATYANAKRFFGL